MIKIIGLLINRSAPNRCVEIMNVTAHKDNEDNERADALEKEGVELRF